MNYNANMMRFASFLLALSFLMCAVAPSAHAVPSLVPLLPLIGVLAMKIVVFLGALFFFSLSLFKKHARLFSIGVGFFVAAIALLIFL